MVGRVLVEVGLGDIMTSEQRCWTIMIGVDHRQFERETPTVEGVD